jgi:predicted acetyltransferase
MELVSPSTKYKKSFIEAVKEFQADDDFTNRTKWYKERSIPELEADFDSFAEREVSHSRGENLPAGYVPCSEYWLVDDGTFIGRSSLRHQLNAHLMYIGGNIGYDIRPSERGKGYGNKILALTLEKAKELGLHRVLLTVDGRNTASRKVIEMNGGVFENRVPNHEKGFEGHDALRYWIDIR